ncbi:hypothetical protein [Parvimonas sp. G1425]|uniref:hypothetical protein n=1 Tax=Parvimonas sp. G1425 TaxID=3387694 RepID=UPI0039E49A03
MDILNKFNKTAIKILNSYEEDKKIIVLIEIKWYELGKSNIINDKYFMNMFLLKCRNTS